MNGWEITIIALMVVETLIYVDKRGQSKGVYDPFMSLLGNLIWFFIIFKAGLFH
ncbi:MAG: hypothetical protein ABFD50_15435 [Smithella sp.]